MAWKEHVSNWVPPEDADGYVHSSKFETEYLLTPEELLEKPYPWNLQTLCTDNFIMNDDTSINVYFESNDQANLLPCRVLKRTRKDDDYFYTVELQMNEDNLVIAQDFPHGDNGVKLYDKAYSSMWHMKEAFRHKLFVPDDMFPENWMANQN